MKDWIELFLEVTEGMRSPPSFRLWAGITTIAGALERRVWTATDTGILYPNAFVILTGGPASGKTLMVLQARQLWNSVSGLHVGPDNPTKASFLDSLEGAVRVTSKGPMPIIFHSLSVACREFGVMFPRNDIAFLEDLTDLYDNPPKYHAPRRTSKSVDIDKPTVNILAAITPDKLGDFMPETAWGQGFTSRLLFIYGVNPPTKDRDIFKKPSRERQYGQLIDRLSFIFEELYGEFEWDDEAAQVMNHWYNEGMLPTPTYSRLRHYLGRRETHVIKLAMISAISSRQSLQVTVNDVNRALSWLLSAEETMPDVFRAMAQKSDRQLLDDLHSWMYGKWSSLAREKRCPILEEVVLEFLSNKVPSERVPVILDMAHRTGRIRPGNVAGSWVPQTYDKITNTE